jgi:hypothetical protein
MVQREAACGLLRASLSAKGYQMSRDIMQLNHHLAELVSNFGAYGEHFYWFAIFGESSVDKLWGWQIEGHHLIINYFVLGNQIVMTPTFMGSEPVTATSGQYAGTSILEPEQDLALDFMRSLPPEQQAARIRLDKGRSENVAEMFKDNVVIPFKRLAPAQMSPAHRDALMELIGICHRWWKCPLLLSWNVMSDVHAPADGCCCPPLPTSPAQSRSKDASNHAQSSPARSWLACAAC